MGGGGRKGVEWEEKIGGGSILGGRGGKGVKARGGKKSSDGQFGPFLLLYFSPSYLGSFVRSDRNGGR